MEPGDEVLAHTVVERIKVKTRLTMNPWPIPQPGTNAGMGTCLETSIFITATCLEKQREFDANCLDSKSINCYRFYPI